uniref:HepT-like ribonuclease domain-containing protein n=1 Tax=Halomonas sp. TaxID=1486246 RepID=UPI0026229FB3|nr:DUF86 domain-containing protein [Halomonas sp.]
MSDGSHKREWRFYIDDMIGFARKVQSYTDGLEQQSFISNDLIYDTVLRNLELIGKAATRVPNDIRLKHTEVPWRMIIAPRNRLAHAYLGIDDVTIWSIIQDNIPELQETLEKINAVNSRVGTRMESRVPRLVDMSMHVLSWYTIYGERIWSETR